MLSRKLQPFYFVLSAKKRLLGCNPALQTRFPEASLDRCHGCSQVEGIFDSLSRETWLHGCDRNNTSILLFSRNSGPRLPWSILDPAARFKCSYDPVDCLERSSRPFSDFSLRPTLEIELDDFPALTSQELWPCQKVLL
ncbi:hypothetical protein MRX96_040025 [Rhipicephalus microplus]